MNVDVLLTLLLVNVNTMLGKVLMSRRDAPTAEKAEIGRGTIRHQVVHMEGINLSSRIIQVLSRLVKDLIHQMEKSHCGIACLENKK